MSLSTKKVSFENHNKSLESSPGLQKSKALRNTIYKNFLEEQQSFENLRNLVNLRRVQSTGATIGDSEHDEHLSDIDLTQAKLEDSHVPQETEEDHEEMEHVEEDKENHSHLANEREYNEHVEQPSVHMSYLEVKNATQPQESMDLSNSSRVSVPQLNEQAYKAPSLNQTPNKQEEDHSLEVIPEVEAPQVQITTPHGSQKRMENSASGDKSRLWASLSNLSPSKNPSLKQNNSQKYRSVSDVANEAIKQSHLSQFGKKKYEEEHQQEEPQQSIRLDEDLKASNLSHIQIDRPNMDPLVASGDKLDSHRSFKDVPAYNPEHSQENYMSLVDQSLDHPNEEVSSDKKKSRLAYLNSKEETPWSMVLDRSLKKVQESNVARSVNMLPNDDLDLNLERLRDLRFRYEGKRSDGPSGVEKVLDISRILAMRSSLQNEEQQQDDEESLKRHEESERLRKEEEEKQIRREAGAYKFESALEKIITKINEEDLQDGFECIREEYYEQLELIRLGKISRGFEKLDQGILNDRTFLSIGLEELKEHLNQCLINQHAQDFREKMLAYNSLMALKEYALHVKRKLAKEAQAKQHFRYNKLRKVFDTIQQHSISCKEWLENVKSELRLLKKSKIFDAWRADAREQKINRLTDQLIEKKQMKLKQKIVNFWKDETIQQYRIPLQKGIRRYKFRLVKRAYKILKAYAVKRNISKENNMKAYLFMMKKLTKKGFNGLVPFYMKEQTRKLNVDDYEDFIPLRICIKDKVTKISSEDKDWASLNNERRVMIDVVKNKK